MGDPTNPRGPDRGRPAESDGDQLLERLIEPGLSSEERTRLGALLHTDPALRSRYLDHCQLHAMLRTEQGLLAAMETPNVVEARAALRPAQRIARWGAVAAAVVVALAARGWVAMDSAPLPHRGAVVATIGKSVGGRFEHGPVGEPFAEEGAAVRAGKYHLLDGLVEVEFPSGALLVLQAPCVIELVSNTWVRLEQGRLSAHVPPAAIGFRIESPGATVIDLGTDFAVQADRDEGSEVHVFEGEVLVDLHPQKGAEADALRLVTGEAARIDFFSGMPSGIDLDSQRFIRTLRSSDSRYAQMVLALDPVVYYPMEPSGDGSRLVDRSPSGAHAEIHFGGASEPVWAAGKVGSALALGGPAQQTYASAARYPQATGDTLSVVAWVNAHSRPRWASIVKNWAAADDRGQFHFGLLHDSGRLEAHIQDSSGQEVTVCDRAALPLRSWRHVAFVADGAMLRLYRDGEQIDAAPYHELRHDPRLHALAIGTKLNLAGTAPEERDFNMWDGRLDEVAVFNHALSPDAIRGLYLAGSAN